MTKRKAITKKLRFEVFKRDCFTCQYCGRKAPDVILEVDHIKPVAKGGDNSITNLITACWECNHGKKDIPLNEKQTLEKQRKQLEEIQERRNQLKMLQEWYDETKNLEFEKIELYHSMVRNACFQYYSLNENGLSKLKKWIKKFTHEELSEAITIAFEQEFKNFRTVEERSQKFNIAYNLIPKIIEHNRQCDKNPYLKDACYLRGIIKNKIPYNLSNMHLVRIKDCLIKLLEDLSFDYLKNEILNSEIKNLDDFYWFYEELMEDLRRDFDA